MPSELLTCLRKSPKINTINQTDFVVLKKISFAGVSAAAIALAVLLPSPARALSVNWSFVSGSDTFSGTIENLSDGSNTSSSTPIPYVTVTQAPSSYSNLISQQLGLASGGEMFVSGGVPLDNGNTYSAEFFSNSNSELYYIYFRNGLNGTFEMEAVYDNINDSTLFQYSPSSSRVSFTAVPAPLPLLGLGAATAFSRKLKQRIALRRKREEVGLAG